MESTFFMMATVLTLEVAHDDDHEEECIANQDTCNFQSSLNGKPSFEPGSFLGIHDFVNPTHRVLQLQP